MIQQRDSISQARADVTGATLRAATRRNATPRNATQRNATFLLRGTMKTFIASLESVSPYSQSRYHNTPKLEKESPEDYEKRTWRERLHTDNEGIVFIPPMVFKNCLTDAAEYLSIKVKGGGGRSRYTKHFQAGVLVTDGLSLGIKKEDCQSESLFLSPEGKKGGGTRVEKCYPIIHKWSGDVSFYILDDIITEEIFRYHLEQAGSFIGIGRFRPRNRGFYGRFKVNDLIAA